MILSIKNIYLNNGYFRIKRIVFYYVKNPIEDPILSYLNYKELCDIRLINNHYNEVVREVNVNDTITNIHNPEIWYKNFSKSIGITEIWNDMEFKNLNKLTHLELKYCNQITDESFKNLNSLTHLKLYECNQITNEAFKNLNKLKYIKSL